MSRYSDLTLIGMTKSNLIKYIRWLEEKIGEYDAEVNKQHDVIKIAKEDLEFIDEQLGKDKPINNLIAQEKARDLKKYMEEQYGVMD